MPADRSLSAFFASYRSASATHLTKCTAQQARRRGLASVICVHSQYNRKTQGYAKIFYLSRCTFRWGKDILTPAASKEALIFLLTVNRPSQ